MMAAKKVYAAITAVTAELATSGIAKQRTNAQDGYTFRGIDDIYNALSPLLARHRLCILPRILERSCAERRASNGDPLSHVTIRAAFEFIAAEDGSKHVVETYGEAMDQGDKATAKAMSAAYKYAAMQTFCIPTDGDNDADASTRRPRALPESELPPVEGWADWAANFRQVAEGCLTPDALARLQATYRDKLRLLSKAEPTLYAELGEVIRTRRAAVAVPAPQKAAA